MSRNQFRVIVVAAAIVIVLADAASGFAVPLMSAPEAGGVAATPARGGLRRMGPDGFAVGRNIEARRAIGYLAGAEALAVATVPAPDDDSCWFYSDPSQSVGYWGDCPQ